MKKDNSSKAEAAWESDNKTWWNRRSKLEKNLLITIVIIIVLTSGLIIYIAIKPKIVSATSSCSTPGCLQAASQIINHIDPEIDPCDDFFKFACGKFIEQTHGDIKAASIQEVEDQVNRQFAEILKEPISEDDNYAMQIEKELFQACMNETAVEKESIEVLKEHLTELNGWPVVIGYKWKERLFHWTDMIAKLRKLGYPYEMLLEVGVTTDPVEKEKYIVEVSPPYGTSVEKEHKELYKKYMTDIAMIFGAADRHRASLEMEKVLDLRERLTKVGDKYRWGAETDESKRNYTATALESRYTIEEFEGYNNEIDWADFLNAVLYPVANISRTDHVIFPNKEFVEAFFTLIYKTPRKTLANYIIWSVVENITPFLTKEIKQLDGNYSCLTKESSISMDRFEKCTMLLRGSVFPEPTNIIYARRYLSPEKREKVQELLGNVKAEFRSILKQNSWMDDESKQKAVEKIDSLTDIVGAPGDYFDDAVFEKYQTVNYTQPGNLLLMLLDRSRHENDLKFYRIYETINDTSDDIFYHLTTKVNAMYSLFDNTIILPVGILQGVFYNSDRPMYLNYGAIGSIIGHELTHGFCKDASNYDKDGKDGHMWSEDTEKAYDEAKQCIIENAEDFDVEDTEQTINGTLTLEENIADFTGVKVSYAAYKKWVDENGEEQPLPGIEYTPNQLFWISAISYECFKISGERLERGLESDSHAHNAFRATAPMRNNDDFASDFSCPVDSNMNPAEKCQVF